LFKSALAIFFVLGVAGPVIYVLAGKPAEPFYETAVYVVTAVIFWLWLNADARQRGVPAHWALLVGIAWLPFSVITASLYLLSTRGVRAGGAAILALFAIVLQFFAVLALGVIVSVGAINILGAS
jgi:hypothetical protein